MSWEQMHNKWRDPEFCRQEAKFRRQQESEKLILKTASSVLPKPTDYIYHDFLARGELTVIAGATGDGKTSLKLFLAAGITRGSVFQFSENIRPSCDGHVFIFNTEDDESTTLRNRLESAGADLDKVHFVDCLSNFGDELPFSFADDRHIERLVGHAELIGHKLAAIIIDPLYMAVDGDHGSNFKARVAYQRLVRLAKRLNCAILGISHAVRNPRGKEALSRVAGPPSLREVPRTLILLQKNVNGLTASGGTHVMVLPKNNNGRLDYGFEYRIREVEIPGLNGPIRTVKFEITKELTGFADEILKVSDQTKSVESTSKQDLAVGFLQDVLKDTPRLRIDIDALAEEAGIKQGTMMNAKTSLKIVTKKREGDGRSEWRLPDSLVDDGASSE